MELAQFIKTMSPKEREAFAKKAKTSVGYLAQLSGGHRKASPQLAKRIEQASGCRVSKVDLRPDIFADVAA